MDHSSCVRVYLDGQFDRISSDLGDKLLVVSVTGLAEGV